MDMSWDPVNKAFAPEWVIQALIVEFGTVSEELRQGALDPQGAFLRVGFDFELQIPAENLPEAHAAIERVRELLKASILT